jgi:hypothetical protein
VAAAAAAAVRSGANILGFGTSTDPGEHAVAGEVKLRMDFIQPVIKEKALAGKLGSVPSIPDSVRARQNIAEHFGMGSGALALQLAAFSPQAAQRGGTGRRRGRLPCSTTPSSQADAAETSQGAELTVGAKTEVAGPASCTVDGGSKAGPTPGHQPSVVDDRRTEDLTEVDTAFAVVSKVTSGTCSLGVLWDSSAGMDQGHHQVPLALQTGRPLD